MLAVRLGASRAVDGSAAPLLDQMPALAHGRFCTRSLSIILLTIPIFFPVFTAPDFGLPPGRRVRRSQASRAATLARCLEQRRHLFKGELSQIRMACRGHCRNNQG